jgi:hypothetical protein
MRLSTSFVTIGLATLAFAAGVGLPLLFDAPGTVGAQEQPAPPQAQEPETATDRPVERTADASAERADALKALTAEVSRLAEQIQAVRGEMAQAQAARAAAEASDDERSALESADDEARMDGGAAGPGEDSTAGPFVFLDEEGEAAEDLDDDAHVHAHEHDHDHGSTAYDDSSADDDTTYYE